jgi:polar amino acid transport system substrate-binding protein
MIKNVQTDPYTFGFSLFRTPARENQYKWVVPVTLPIRSILVKLKSRDDIVVNSLDEAKRYKIGIVNGNNLETTLKKSGFTKLEGVSTNEINYKKLFGGRIDLVAIREPTIMSELKKKGFSTDDIEIAFALDTGREAWLLTNLKTPDDIIKKLQNAYEVLKKEKVIEKMTRKYY